MVIQRWQSVLLLITAVMMACFTFMSLGQVQCEFVTLDFTTIGFNVEGETPEGMEPGYFVRTWPLFVISVLSFILPLINIFLYRNLRKQKTVCLVELLIIFTVCCSAAAYGYFAVPDYFVSWSSAVVAPLIAFVADLLAYRLICRDQRALRSADRIR